MHIQKIKKKKKIGCLFWTSAEKGLMRSGIPSPGKELRIEAWRWRVGGSENTAWWGHSGWVIWICGYLQPVQIPKANSHCRFPSSCQRKDLRTEPSRASKGRSAIPSTDLEVCQRSSIIQLIHEEHVNSMCITNRRLKYEPLSFKLAWLISWGDNNLSYRQRCAPGVGLLAPLRLLLNCFHTFVVMHRRLNTNRD